MSAANSRLKTPNAEANAAEEAIWDQKTLPSPKKVRYFIIFIFKAILGQIKF